MSQKTRNTAILIIDDDPEIRYALGRVLAGRGYSILTAGNGREGMELAAEGKPDLVFLDNRMEGMTGLEVLQHLRAMDPRLMIILMTAYGTTQTAIEAMKFGAYDYIVKPFDLEKALSLAESACLARKASVDAERHPVSLIDSKDYGDGIVGSSELMQAVYKTIGQVAATDITVMITGESGTGKELVARCLYNHSLRKGGPFSAVNCAALPENLIESELFGHEKGAFTGALIRKIGKFESCHKGTIFLDEIGDMSHLTQTKILRVLQEGEIQRVGGNATLAIDIRLIAATNRDLEKMVADNQFREDLYYRLNVVRIRLPSLRERVEDLPQLVAFILQRMVSKGQTKVQRLSPAANSILMRYAWPGNVRQLENTIQHSALMAQGETILPKDLPEELLRSVEVVGVGFREEAKPWRNAAAKAKGIEAKEKTTTPSGNSEPVSDKCAEGESPVGEENAHQKNGLPPEMDPDVSFDRVYQTLRGKTDQAILRTLEIEMIRRALQETGGNQVKASLLLGITRTTLRKRIAQFEIRY